MLIPYTVREDVNMRLIFMQSEDGSVQSYQSARLYEGGFVLIAGRAGIYLSNGDFLPYGSEVRFGYYIVSFDSDEDFLVLEFEDMFPRIPNSQTHAPFLQNVYHPSLPMLRL